MTCGAAHKDDPLKLCQRNSSAPHEFHSYYDFEQDGFVEWPNDQYTPVERKGKKTGNRQKLLKMVQNIKRDEGKVTFYPTESTTLGRAALYLQKYPNEWIRLDELEMKTVAGNRALRAIKELTHHFGWNITEKTGADGTLTHVKFIPKEEQSKQ